jgi:hypothetical protein
MDFQYLAAKLFLGLAVLFAVVGAVFFPRDVIGSGLDGTDYLNPLY